MTDVVIPKELHFIEPMDLPFEDIVETHLHGFMLWKIPSWFEPEVHAAPIKIMDKKMALFEDPFEVDIEERQIVLLNHQRYELNGTRNPIRFLQSVMALWQMLKTSMLCSEIREEEYYRLRAFLCMWALDSWFRPVK